MEAQCKYGVRADGVLSLIVGGREVRLARVGIREHDAFLGHEMRGPAGTERVGVSMAGGQEGQGARKGNGVKRLRQIGAEMVSDSKATTYGGVVSCKIEEQCKYGVRADGVSSLIVAAGERRGLLGVGFENMMRFWVMK